MQHCALSGAAPGKTSTRNKVRGRGRTIQGGVRPGTESGSMPGTFPSHIFFTILICMCLMIVLGFCASSGNSMLFSNQPKSKIPRPRPQPPFVDIGNFSLAL